jgi:N-acylneuraminate cytidylyltransferase
LNIAVIPARSGSKRIPKKNIKIFCGKPMIAWSIEEAINSKCFDKVIVSTDCKKIKEVAEQYGAEVPFLRPDILSDDFVPTIPVIQHAIKKLNDLKVDVDNVCCVYATAPFISSSSIAAGLKKLNKNNYDYVFSAATFPSSIHRALSLDSKDIVRMYDLKNISSRSQDISEAWQDVGQFYWGKKEAWLAGKEIFNSYSSILPIDRKFAHDIDTIEDWNLAELFHKVIYR